MASLYTVPDSFPDAKAHLGEYLINLSSDATINYQIIREVLQKHPDLVNCEFTQKILGRNPDLVNFEKEQELGFLWNCIASLI